MASVIDDKKKSTAQVQSTSAAAAESPSAAASPYSGLSGLSENTSKQLGVLGGGYTPSQNVTAAQQYLQSVASGKPGDYQSQYKGQLESLYNQVMNRDPFKFDLNGDVLYNQYKDQYTQQGKKAMQDTMGQAAAMTGGYGNSYAQMAGQQTYQDYLAQLNNIVPEIYQMALNQYNQEGADLQNKLSLTQGLEDSEYGKYRDTVSDWNTERGYASDEYWNQYNADYSNYANMLNYWNTLAQQENAQYNTDRQMAYTQAMSILQSGKMPSTDLLNAAGISASDAKLLMKKSSSGGGGGSKKSSGSDAPKTETDVKYIQSYSELGPYAKTVFTATGGGSGKGSNPITENSIKVAVGKAYDAGKITDAEAYYILTKRGIKAEG